LFPSTAIRMRENSSLVLTRRPPGIGQVCHRTPILPQVLTARIHTGSARKEFVRPPLARIVVLSLSSVMSNVSRS